MDDFVFPAMASWLYKPFMKNVSNLLPIFLLLIGTVLFFSQSPENQKNALKLPPQGVQAIAGGGLILPANPQRLKDRKQSLEESQRIVEAIIAKNEKGLPGYDRSPAVKQIVLDQKMKRRSALYQPLFTKWGVDAETISKVMDVVRDREAELQDIRTALLREGTDGVPEAELYRANAESKAFKKLESLLGKERSKDLEEIDRSETQRMVNDTMSKFRD